MEKVMGEWQADLGRYNDHPGYADGFADASDGEPLFPDAAPEYAAGWRGWYAAREILTDMMICGALAK